MAQIGLLIFNGDKNELQAQKEALEATEEAIDAFFILEDNSKQKLLESLKAGDSIIVRGQIEPETLKEILAKDVRIIQI